MRIILILLASALLTACGTPFTEGQLKAISETARDIAIYEKALDEFTEEIKDLETYAEASPELLELSFHRTESYMRSLSRMGERFEESVDMMNYVMKNMEHPARFLYTLCDSIESAEWINKHLCNNDEISNKLGMLAGTVMFRASDYTTGLVSYQKVGENLLNILKQEIYHDYYEQPGYLTSYYLPLYAVTQNMKEQGQIKIAYVYRTEGGSDNSYIVGYSNQTAFCITFHSSESTAFHIEQVEFDSSLIDYDTVKSLGFS